MDAIKEVMASGQRSPKARISGNPVTVGQGQHFFIQLRNREDFTFTAKEKKNAKRSKGTMSIAKEHPEKTERVSMMSGGFEKAGYVAWSGTHKRPGKRMPWIIQLPRKKGKTGSVKFGKLGDR